MAKINDGSINDQPRSSASSDLRYIAPTQVSGSRQLRHDRFFDENHESRRIIPSQNAVRASPVIVIKCVHGNARETVLCPELWGLCLTEGAFGPTHEDIVRAVQTRRV